jgi:hypothetical protein
VAVANDVVVMLGALFETVKELLVTERLPPVTPEEVVAVNVQVPAVPRIKLLKVAMPELFVLTLVVPERVPHPDEDIAIGAPLTALPLAFLYVTTGAGLRAVPTVPLDGCVLKLKVAIVRGVAWFVISDLGLEQFTEFWLPSMVISKLSLPGGVALVVVTGTLKVAVPDSLFWHAEPVTVPNDTPEGRFENVMNDGAT